MAHGMSLQSLNLETSLGEVILAQFHVQSYFIVSNVGFFEFICERVKREVPLSFCAQLVWAVERPVQSF